VGGTDDCNGRADDGCETNLNTDLAHCGVCGDVCDPDHATAAKCQGGECLIDFDEGGCAGAWLDCNGMPDDGCEINTTEDVDNCGDCGAACSDSHGTPSCDTGTCVSNCDPGYADCDDDVWSNGCEANTLTSVTTCGGCDAENVCDEGSPTQSPFCDDGTCDLADCPSGFGDCDGDTVCSDDLTTQTNCGSCGNPCGVTNATTSCEDQGSFYDCEITGCVDSGGAEYEDCDGTYDNGCETNVLSNPNDCGGCAPGPGTNCTALKNNSSLHINSINCSSGDCVITGCTTGYSDCDLNPTNGCESHIVDDPDRCGACLSTDPKGGSGVDCSAQPNTTGQCINYACEIDQCALSFGTGCERNLTRVIFGSTGTTGTFLVTYNATNLVVTATINDSNIYTTSDGGEPWDNDGIEIYIDLNNAKSGSFQSDDFQIRSTLGTTSVSGLGAASWGAISVNQTYTVGMSPYTVVVTIPWAALNGASQPAQGTVIGFDLAINADNNSGPRDAQLMMFGSDQNFNNPSFWGTLRLN
jgi:hypothetical protein